MIHCIISWLYQYLKGAWDGKTRGELYGPG